MKRMMEREGGRDDAKLINEKQDLEVLTTHEWCHETCPYLSPCVVYKLSSNRTHC